MTRLLSRWRSTRLPGVELACASGRTQNHLDVRPQRVEWNFCAAKVDSCGLRNRAYSSIGQSPRLITGLFLVQTQVGPLPPIAALRGACNKESLEK